MIDPELAGIKLDTPNTEEKPKRRLRKKKEEA
jgi:hypothetical protein